MTTTESQDVVPNEWYELATEYPGEAMLSFDGLEAEFPGTATAVFDSSGSQEIDFQCIDIEGSKTLCHHLWREQPGVLFTIS